MYAIRSYYELRRGLGGWAVRDLRQLSPASGARLARLHLLLGKGLAQDVGERFADRGLDLLARYFKLHATAPCLVATSLAIVRRSIRLKKGGRSLPSGGLGGRNEEI